MAIKTGGEPGTLKGVPFVRNLPHGQVHFIRCDGCGVNFPAGSGHVSFSRDCDEVREERLWSRAH